MLTDEQIAIINHTQGKAVVIAVAGSGKTTTLVNRAKNLIGSACLIVYNRTAADDVKAKYKKNGVSSDASTIHSLAFRRAGQDGVKIDTTKLFGIPGGPDMFKVLFSIALGLKITIDQPTDWTSLPEIMAESLLNEYSTDDELGVVTDLNPDDVRKFIGAYKYHKLKNGLYDFSDLMQICIDRQLPFNYNHVMLDEAQDVTPLRIRFAELMMQNAQSFVAVGDPAQGIYAYQGAKPAWLLSLAERSDFTTFKLSTSWRLPTSVAQYSNTILPLTELGALSSVNCRPDAPEGVCYTTPTSTAYQDACSRISELADQDTLVLARTRLSLARLIKYTTTNGIPFRTLAPEALPWSSNLGQEVIGYLEFANGYVTPRFRKIVNKPVRYIRGADIQEIVNRFEDGQELQKILSVMSINNKAMANLRIFYNGIRSLSWDRQIEKVRRQLIEYVENSRYDLDRQDEMKEFYNFLCDELRTMSGMEELWTRMEEEVTLSNDKDAPLLFSTIHRSKGLEAKNVILMGLSREFPSPNAVLADEAKVYYVACTRAKEALHIYTPYDGLSAISPPLKFEAYGSSMDPDEEHDSSEDVDDRMFGS